MQTTVYFDLDTQHFITAEGMTITNLIVTDYSSESDAFDVTLGGERHANVLNGIVRSRVIAVHNAVDNRKGWKGVRSGES